MGPCLHKLWFSPTKRTFKRKLIGSFRIIDNLFRLLAAYSMHSPGRRFFLPLIVDQSAARELEGLNVWKTSAYDGSDTVRLNTFYMEEYD